MELEELKQWAKEKHAGQTRKHGTPYYLHPFAVCDMLEEKGFGIEYQIPGLFHDLIEDTDATYEQIIKKTNKEIAQIVKLLTKEPGYKMEEYISRIKENEIARMVKLADRVHNLTESVFASIDFRIKYVEETKQHFLKLSQDTVFEKELINVIRKVEASIDDETR